MHIAQQSVIRGNAAEMLLLFTGTVKAIKQIFVIPPVFAAIECGILDPSKSNSSF